MAAALRDTPSREHRHRRALLLCATAQPHAAQQAQLLEALGEVDDFFGFADRAEEEGIAPLVALHASSHVPLPLRLTLQALAGRHRLAHAARTIALADAVEALTKAGIPHLFSKGAALSVLAYPQPELRAMRDVDLLVRDQDLPGTQRALAEAGFSAYRPAPPDCHEVFTMDRTVDGFSIRVDVHRRIGLFELPLYRPATRQALESLWPDARPFALGRAQTHAPSPEDLLRIVYRHAFTLGLYERYRLVSIADLATAMERWVAVLDWQRLRALDHRTFAGLAMVHHAVPLSAAVLQALDYAARRAPPQVGEHYDGFFSSGEPGSSHLFQQLSQTRWARPGTRSAFFWGGPTGTSFWRLLRSTLAPSPWWLRIRHGVRGSSVSAYARHCVDLLFVALCRFTGRGNVRR